jgi:hypothetical protein
MQTIMYRRSVCSVVLALLIVVGVGLKSLSLAADAHMHTSKPFAGAKANTGTVTHSKDETKNILTLSDDFKTPDTPDPHWQVVDSHGTVYLLQKLSIKGDKMNRSITLPPYIRDIAKVQIWCAFAETVLGEAAFDSPVK